MFIVSVLLHEDDLDLLVTEGGELSGEFVDLARCWPLLFNKWEFPRITCNIGGSPYHRVDIVAHAPVDLDDFTRNDVIGRCLAAALHPYIAEIRHWQASGHVTAENARGSLVRDQHGVPLPPLDSALFRGMHAVSKDGRKTADSPEEVAALLETGEQVYIEPYATPIDDLVEMVAENRAGLLDEPRRVA